MKLKDKIKEKIDKLPEELLKEVNDFVDFLLHKNKKRGKIKIEGLWKGWHVPDDLIEKAKKILFKNAMLYDAIIITKDKILTKLGKVKTIWQ